MPHAYKTAVAFRQALEQRLKSTAAERGTPLNTLRLNVTIERLLARLAASTKGAISAAAIVPAFFNVLGELDLQPCCPPWVAPEPRP